MAAKIEKFGTCQLCMEEKPLQKKCHLLPKFFQKAIQKEGNTGVISSGKWRKAQDHFYGNYLYCRDCENNIFNRYGEKPVADRYGAQSNPFYDNDYSPMHLSISICFRVAQFYQAQSALRDFSEPIRYWRQWLLKKGTPSPLLIRVGSLTYDRSGDLPFWQSIAAEIMFMDVAEYNGLELVVANTPGMIFCGVVKNIGKNDPNTFFDSDPAFAKMATTIVTTKLKAILCDLPTESPNWLLNAAKKKETL